MSTWSNILCKYRYVNTRSKEGLDQHSFLKHAASGIAEGVIVVACRGQSYEALKQTTWVDICGVFVVVNDWRPGPLPELVAKHKDRAVNYLTDMPARVDRWKSCGVPALRSSRALSINKEVVDALDEEKRKAFHALWDTKDTGLRAIAIVSLRCNVVVIAGLDFWEAPYWGSKPLHADRGADNVAELVRKKTAGKMEKGSKYKDRWLNAFIDYMEAMTDTQFVFYTYSSSLTHMIRTRDIQNASVEPIEYLLFLGRP